MSGGWYVTVAALIGAVIGSFLNVCIHRLPLRESIVRPGSQCPQCHAPIAWYDNIPIFSFLWLRGRCRRCRTRIAWRYPLVEALNAAGYGFIAWRFGVVPAGLVYGALFSALIVVAFVDLDHMIIPNAITYPGMALGLLAGMAILPVWWDSLAGFLLGGVYLYLIALMSRYVFKKEGMGMGDVKLLAMIGAVVGWKLTIFVALLSALLGSIIGLSCMAAQRVQWGQQIPFGPYLCAAAVVAILFGSDFVNWYEGLLSGRR